MSDLQTQMLIRGETRSRRASAAMAGNLKKQNLIPKVTTSVQLLVCLVLIAGHLGRAAESPLTSRAAFLRAQRAATAQRQQQPAVAAAAASNQTNPSSSSTTTEKPKIPRLETQQQQQQQQQQPQLANNRSTRTTDLFENGQGFNIFVNTICDRESMRVTVDTSEPFYGIIHTRDQRAKPVCTVEGTGAKRYELQISQVLRRDDPEYCGVIKAARKSPEDRDLLQALLVVRVHKNIERGDDKFFLINCTNQCRRDDCSRAAAPAGVAPDKLAKLERERESEEVTPTSGGAAADKRPGGFGPLEGNEECNIYKFPWAITLLWCMAILLLAMIISHCIMCSSLVCRCVKTEVEERAPSVYEDGAGGTLRLTDDEDRLYNRKNHPMRIDYDNRDIYKTSNNYEPYDLRDEQCEEEQEEANPRTRHSKSRSRR